MKRHVAGIMNAVVAAVSYGANPLFALPLIQNGIGVDSVLFYRYAFAVLIYGVWIKFIKKYSLKINKNEFWVLLCLGLLFSMSSLTLFESFKYIEAGVACTVLFIYPVIVAVIMNIFFKEKLSLKAVFSIIITLIGIVLLYNGKSNTSLDIKGIGLVLFSALFYALYIVGVKNITIVHHIKIQKLNFYVMLFGLFVYIYNLNFCIKLQILNTCFLWTCVLALAIIPTVVSIETINKAIKLIGSTKTAVLGALEPISAIIFGIIFFNQHLTIKMFAGVFLVLSGVILIIYKNN